MKKVKLHKAKVKNIGQRMSSDNDDVQLLN